MPTGVIMAGGRSSRMGRAKAIVPVGGIPMIVRVAAAVREVADDLVVVANDVALGAGLDARIVPDETPGEGPLAGLTVGLEAAASDECVVVACDMPFVRPRLLSLMLERAADADAVVPRWADGSVEPLHAVYRRTCARAARAALASGKRRANAFFDDVRVAWLEEPEWRAIDPDARSWWNVNTPSDLVEAEAYAARA